MEDLSNKTLALAALLERLVVKHTTVEYLPRNDELQEYTDFNSVAVELQKEWVCQVRQPEPLSVDSGSSINEDSSSQKAHQDTCRHGSIEEIQGGQIERCRLCGKEWG